MSNRNEVAPGKGFLKVTGVFYIIVGAISIITSLFLMDTANAVSGMGSLFNVPNLGISSGIRWIAFFNVFVGIFSIIIGITGISYCEDLEKATLLITLAIIDIVLSIISLIAIEFSWTSLIFLALPICFLIGAQKNLGVRQSYPTGTTSMPNNDMYTRYNEAKTFYNNQQYDKAVPLFQVLANEGSINAQAMLGWCISTGKGTTVDETKAAEWYRKAADRGHISAQFNLGVFYENGQGVTKDIAKAIELYHKAAAQGDVNAQKALDRLKAEGKI